MPISTYKEMQERQAEIQRLIGELLSPIKELKELGISVDDQALSDLIQKQKNDKFKVLVIGEFKNGKSTFINSLMGEKVLPAYSTPCTAVINEVKYGKEKKAKLFFKNPLPEEMCTDINARASQHMKKYEGKEIPPLDIDVSELVDYVTIPDETKDQANSIRELPYSKVVLEYPINLCHDGIEIIDSPGLNENGTRTKVTEKYLSSADAIVFVFMCPKIAGKADVDYIQDQIHPRGYRDIFFVCNGINKVPEEEKARLTKFGNGKLEALTDLGQNGIFYVDALSALKAKIKHEDEILRKTGIPEFEAALSEYLRNNKGKTKLMQTIELCVSYMDKIEREQVASYAASLERDVEELKKKIRDNMPYLELAEQRKQTVQRKISNEMSNLEKDIADLMNRQYDNIIRGIPEVVDKMDIENHMTINPFTQKDRKSALENEVIGKIDQYVQKQMGAWIESELNPHIDAFIDDLQRKLGEDIDIFYRNLDEFRYDVSGIEKPKDISGIERITATIFGTLLCGPTYGVLGATLGLGEMAKRSALTIGASIIAAFTPLGLTALTAAIVGAGILQIATGGKALTDKYKAQIKDGFINSIRSNREESSAKYAAEVAKDVKEKFGLVVEALDNEIDMEKSKIKALEEDAEKGEEERSRKLAELKVISQEIAEIREGFDKVREEIE